MTQPPQAAIQLADAAVYYGQTCALEGINLEIAPGQTHVLLGPSGSGKTTLLRNIAGFEKLHRGSLSLHGKIVDQGASPSCWIPPEKRNVGFVFQDYALFPHLSVADNIAFALKAEQKETLSTWLQRVDLDSLASRMPSTLSGGQQQRVALARALAQRPTIMLFDEPFSNLDPELRRDLRRQTLSLMQELEITSVFVTHDACEAFAMANRLSIIDQGRIVQSGTTREIYLRPRTRRAAISVGAAYFWEAQSGNTPGTIQSSIGQIPIDTTTQGSLLMLRPEQLSIRAANTSQPGEAIASLGQIMLKKVTFLGAYTTLEISLGDTIVELEVPSSQAPFSQENLCLDLLSPGILLT